MTCLFGHKWKGFKCEKIEKPVNFFQQISNSEIYKKTVEFERSSTLGTVSQYRSRLKKILELFETKPKSILWSDFLLIQYSSCHCLIRELQNDLAAVFFLASLGIKTKDDTNRFINDISKVNL